ncbi:ABC transporter permease, partial [Streptococcus thermophilus]|nr:ABC transporter permease [Streptococcus thermophilus]
MSAMVKRNLKIYFRDKASVFFSMLSVIIIFALYILFIGDSVNSGLKFLPHPNRLM